VAEKMAALDVVKRRLDKVGLGDMCLELHSQKASKRAVLDDLARTISLRRPKAADVEAQALELQQRRDQLNRYVAGLHRPLEASGWTAYRVLGELIRLQAAGVRPADFRLLDAPQWTSNELRIRQDLLQDLRRHLQSA